MIQPFSWLWQNDAAIMNDSNKMALKYIDDLTLVENISVSQQSTIQCDLDSFDQWVTENHMNLNPAKCMFMDITFVKEPPVLPPLRLWWEGSAEYGGG